MTNKQSKYDESFKKNIVALHQNGKTQTELSKEYGISTSAISHWIRLYSEVKVDDDTIMTAKQIKELQKRNAQLKEEMLLLKNQYIAFRAIVLTVLIQQDVMERDGGKMSAILSLLWTDQLLPMNFKRTKEMKCTWYVKSHLVYLWVEVNVVRDFQLL